MFVHLAWSQVLCGMLRGTSGRSAQRPLGRKGVASVDAAKLASILWHLGGGRCLSIYLSIYLYLSVYLSNYLSIYLPFYYLSIDRPIYLSTNIQMAHSHPSQPHLESFGLGTMTFE